jgi:hypothetical protein
MNENEYILSLISAEILLLEKYKFNLKKIVLSDIIEKTKGFSKKYYKILDEVERVAIEVKNLEDQKSDMLNLIEEYKELIIPEEQQTAIIVIKEEPYFFQKPIKLLNQ